MQKVFSVFLALAGTLAAADTLSPPAAGNIQAVHFESKSLGEQRRVSILLPPGYETSTARYPVLYLLHGYGDDQTAWSTKSNLTAYGAHHQMIVVMPDGSKSWYVNAAHDDKAKFEDYIAKDLISFVDTHYRTLPVPRARAIAGLSMGGYGAMTVGLKNYKQYAAIASFSGAVDFAHNPINRGKTQAERDATDKEWMRVFGAKDSPDRDARDPFVLFEKVPVAEMPLLFITCGGEDFLIEGNRQLVGKLAAKRVPYEYREVSPREHTWDFWDDSIRQFLTILDHQSGFSTE